MRIKPFKKFRKDEDGGILAFSLIMFLVMVLGSGMAVDFVRHETKRESLQDALDRGVLAATAFEQLLDPEAVVFSYVEAAGLDPVELGVVVSSDITLNSREVSATGRYDINTFFLKLAGINELPVGGTSAAFIAITDIELSLIVDISGSMGGDKIDNLRTAASEFVDLMITPETEEYTTISLVPFTGQVAPSDNLISSFTNYTRWHNYSNCVRFGPADYNDTVIDTDAVWLQTQHWGPEWLRDKGTDWCPNEDSQIIPVTNDAERLHDAIDLLDDQGMTATYIGMKWGVSLLDPDWNGVINDLISLGDIDAAFDDRPAAWDDDDTRKYIVLMTDGANTEQYRLQNDMYNALDLPFWNVTANANFWNANDTPWAWSHLEQEVSGGQGDVRLQAICDAAKDQGITVFTIGYDVAEDSNPFNQMQACATSEAFFFHVETSDLSEAFATIASVIQKLRLTI